MKNFNKILVLFLGLLPICILAQSSESFELFGERFEIQENLGNSIDFSSIQKGENLNTQLEGQITEVCQAKGCWMKVNLANGEEVFVRFKDYGFFVPTNSAEKTVVMNGVAFIEEMSVEDQQHYAEDEGASKEEIEKITSPKKTYRFEANGVYIN
ncbi:hypothetical protein GCM10011414_19840 [Croceivirga lutea]|uniref:DUF4920 domain-containing protein n=1 Tax=Croceivirga lutea TaxID=1775167 RepID=UPI001639E4F7|nr:DUF4920 domain-containing protein [Croceivirga lutea]GGG50072.1 hypothetical protein GCM10011414_19840 [Croceivirga lutea]